MYQKNVNKKYKFKKKVKEQEGKENYSETNLNMLTCNAAGLKMKTQSLKSVIHYFKSSVFSIQETHFSKKGRFKHENFVIFEAIRKKDGGGSLLGIHTALKPVLISEYSDTIELLIVEINAENKRIRVITGYGPQETWEIDIKMKFFNTLEEEIVKASYSGTSVILMGDLNSKLGPEFIKNDPHSITENGSILAGIMERNALTVVNGLEQVCRGLITRERTTVDSVEKSIIDFVIVSQDIVQSISSMMIDDDRRHVLTKLSKTKKGVIKKESDHNTIVTELKIKWKPHSKLQKKEMFNLKDKIGQEKFKYETDNTTDLSRIIDKEDDVEKATKKFLKRLDGFITNSFKKIRVTEKVDEELEELYKKRGELRNQKDAKSKKKLEEVENVMAEKYSETMYQTIKEELKGINSEDGGWNSGYLWKLKNKVSPRPTDPPTAMENKDGILLTDPTEIMEESLKHYSKLFENLPMDKSYVNVQIRQEKLCKVRLELCARNKTEEWKMEDIEIALKHLKRGTSRDPFGYSNELFKEGVAGGDLKLAVLKLMNKIKDKQQIPQSIQQCNITSLYKNKGPRNKFDSYRGIFRVTVLRSILDRLIYNDMYETLDSNLTDCNVGNRKQRNIRDNLFVLNAVQNSTKRKTEKPEIGRASCRERV